MQREQWTFDGATEVTVNIFAIHACQNIPGFLLLYINWMNNSYDCIKEY